MTDDPYLLFTQCHRLYVQGVRRALRERLESAYGEKWWSDGALGALSDDQRRNVELALEREPTADLESRLDSLYFGRIVSRRYAAAFSDLFADARSAFAQFARVARMRNEWAHVQEMQPAKTMSAIRAMRSALASLRQAEALEVDRLTRDIANEPRFASEDDDMDDRPITDADEAGEDYAVDEISSPPSGFWQGLHSHLTLDTSVAIDEENDNAIITVEVSNTALAGDGLPTVSFNSVQIHAINAEFNRGRYEGNLGPGNSFQAQYVCARRALATASFSVSGHLDINSFFHFQRRGYLPNEIVAPILDEFFERFEALDIKTPFEKALETIRGINPSMTIADLLSARPELERVKSLVANKAQGMDELFRDFQHNNRYSLGKECSEIVGHFKKVARQIQAAENAIGNIDLDTITQVVANLEQIQIAVLRVEDAVRNMRWR